MKAALICLLGLALLSVVFAEDPVADTIEGDAVAEGDAPADCKRGM